jgi:hypothetical protein
MWLKRIAKITTVLISAFVVTSAVMFWLQHFEYHTGYYVKDYVDSYFGDYASAPGYTDYSTQLKTLSPAEERPLLDAISGDLKQKPTAELFQLKAYEDVCAIDAIDCRGLTTAKVKPFIDAILSDRQSAETALYARTSDFIAAGSLFISIVALIFTALSYRRRAPNKTDDRTQTY